ncbi:MAG TPA: MFS transporter [Terracidiphilus sp.]|nr:MFS transporter [Terracidiphilus sp.]
MRSAAGFPPFEMDYAATANQELEPICAADRAGTRQIIGFVYFTFICYVSIGLPLAVLPPYVHLRMGYSAMLAGLAVSIQYVATLGSRPWAGRISDQVGAKIAVLWGMGACTGSGALLLAAAALHRFPLLSFAMLILSRLVLGVGESLGSTGATLWGITAAGLEHTAKVIGYNGVCTYGGMALAAPLGVVLYQRWGLPAIGLVTMLVAGASLMLALRKDPVPVTTEGEHLPFNRVLGRVTPHGMGLALSGVGYSVLATFVALYYASHHWNGAALCLTAFGLGFIVVRLTLIRTISHFGGFPVAMASLAVEAGGLILLWLAFEPWMALVGSAVSGFGLSLVFPAIGVEAVKRVPEQSRGTALGVYTAFADVSFFLTGPIAGAIIGVYGYPSAFLFALISVVAGLGIVIVLRRVQGD